LRIWSAVWSFSEWGTCLSAITNSLLAMLQGEPGGAGEVLVKLGKNPSGA
jgi:hypothetical protein